MNGLKAPIPYGPHHESINDPRLSLRVAAVKAVFNYCPRHYVASMYLEHTERWTMQGPIEAVQFLKEMEGHGFELPSEAVELWLARIHQVAHEIDGGRLQ